MAIKIVGAVCVVCWAIFGISFLFPDADYGRNQASNILYIIGFVGGLLSLFTLAIMALINYARRPR